jgi:Cu(I)/Ag(I) efflux system membrane fusion protein
MVQPGQRVEARVEAYPGEAFKGTVAFKDPALNPSTRTLGVRYDLPNPDGRLRPGMFATVTLTTPIAQTPAFRARMARSNAPGSRPKALSAEDQRFCPVTRAKLGTMGKPIPVQVRERKVWICCAGCEEPLKAEPARFLVRLESTPVQGDAVLAVPESAVIDTGARKVVFVEVEPGVFEGREVVLGPRSGDVYPVLEGIDPGAKVATAGSFLLDAETRLKGTAAGPGVGDERPGPKAVAAAPDATEPLR